MTRYILVYSVDDYPEQGGGDNVEFPESELLLDKRVQEISEDGHTLICAGKLIEYKYKVVETVKKIVRE